MARDQHEETFQANQESEFMPPVVVVSDSEHMLEAARVRQTGPATLSLGPGAFITNGSGDLDRYPGGMSFAGEDGVEKFKETIRQLHSYGLTTIVVKWGTGRHTPGGTSFTEPLLAFEHEDPRVRAFAEGYLPAIADLSVELGWGQGGGHYVEYNGSLTNPHDKARAEEDLVGYLRDVFDLFEERYAIPGVSVAVDLSSDYERGAMEEQIVRHFRRRFREKGCELFCETIPSPDSSQFGQSYFAMERALWGSVNGREFLKGRGSRIDAMHERSSTSRWSGLGLRVMDGPKVEQDDNGNPMWFSHGWDPRLFTIECAADRGEGEVVPYANRGSAHRVPSGSVPIFSRWWTYKRYAELIEVWNDGLRQGWE